MLSKKFKIFAISCLVIGTVIFFLYLEKNTKLLVNYWFEDVFTSEVVDTLFVGSSTIARLPIGSAPSCKSSVKRGFGYGKLSDVSAYLNFIPLSNITNLVLYFGENDIADGSTANEVITELYRLLDDLKAMDHLNIAILSIKPSPRRAQFHPEYKEFNDLLADTLIKFPQVSIIPLHQLKETNLYQDDGIHLNEKGYSILNKWLEQFCTLNNKKRPSSLF